MLPCFKSSHKAALSLHAKIRDRQRVQGLFGGWHKLLIRWRKVLLQRSVVFQLVNKSQALYENRNPDIPPVFTIFSSQYSNPGYSHSADHGTMAHRNKVTICLDAEGNNRPCALIPTNYNDNIAAQDYVGCRWEQGTAPVLLVTQRRHPDASFAGTDVKHRRHSLKHGAMSSPHPTPWS